MLTHTWTSVTVYTLYVTVIKAQNRSSCSRKFPRGSLLFCNISVTLTNASVHIGICASMHLSASFTNICSATRLHT
jgi:hypothetical protein